MPTYTIILLTMTYLISNVSSSTRLMDCYCGTSRVGVRIIGGRESSAHKYPWMASIAKSSDESVFCGGALINDRYILTAAHCVAPESRVDDADDPVVILGHHNVKNLNSASIFKIDAIIPHHKYDIDDPDQKYDIALIRLKDRVRFSDRISPICLPSRITPHDNFRSLIIAGWGFTRRGSDPSDQLMEAVVPEVPMDTCFKLHLRGRVTDDHICAGNKTTDTCDGDSGGPLMTDWIGRMHAVGITSWGIQCAHSYYPAVFTRVYSYAAWINSNTKDAKYCNNRNPYDPYRFDVDNNS